MIANKKKGFAKMMKILPPTTLFNNSENARCGEIYCPSASDFIILCTYCKLKLFEFDDFLLHFKNMHFDKRCLKTEDIEASIDCIGSQYEAVNIKSEVHDESAGVDSWHGDDHDGNAMHSKVLSKLTVPLYEQQNNDNVSNVSNILLEHEDGYVDHIFNGSNTDEYDDGDDDRDVEYKPLIKDINKRIQKKTQAGVKKYKCDYCDRQYKNLKHCRAHVKRAHEQTETSTVKDYVKVQSHNMLSSPKLLAQKPKLQCIECEATFHLQRLLEAHVVEEHNGFQCSNCKKRYKTREILRRHLITHSDEKNFLCDFQNCEKRFHTRRQLKVHYRMHTDQRDFMCDMCGYSCRTRDSLRVHCRTHTGEKPYECKICSKRFISSSMLSEHQASHAKDRPHVCDVCGATFSRPKALYHHKHLHLGIKKFICRICGNAYAQASGLAGHARKHKESCLF